MKKSSGLLIGLAVLLAIGLGLGGWRLYQANEAQGQYKLQVENNYQRSFHQLSSGMDNINAQLAQVLVTTSHEQTLLSLSNLWREVYGTINDLSNLPVAMHELESTDLFLNNVAEYSYYLIRKNILKGNSLNEADWAQIQEFYQRSKVVTNELDQIEAKILNEDLRFSDVPLYLANEENQEENSIVSAFRSIENQVHAFPELDFEEGVRKIEPEPRPITGEQITEVQAIEAASAFLSNYDEQPREAKVEFISEGGAIPIYGVRFYGSKETEPIYIEVSQKGGHVLQMYQYRDIGEAQYDEAEVAKRAAQILINMGFPTMVQVDAQVDNRIVDLTFVPVQNGVYIYSDMVKMQLARDDNKLLNYDQTSYATRHYARPIGSPVLTELEVRTGMNPNFEVTDIRLALITDEYSVNEILTYEVRGTIVEEEFAVFVDAKSGEEIRIVRLTKPQQYLVNTSEE